MPTELPTELATELPAEVSAPPEDWRAAVTGPHPGESATVPAPRRTRTPEPDPSPARPPGSRRYPKATDPARTWQQRAENAEQRVAQLEQALTSRPGIEQAKGVLMAVFALDADAAFAVLVRVSQNSNTRLAVIADQLLRRIADTTHGAITATHVRDLLDELSTGPPGSLPHEPRTDAPTDPTPHIRRAPDTAHGAATRREGRVPQQARS